MQTERSRYTPELIEATRNWQPKPTLPGSAYTDDAAWQDEREKIWFDRWVCIGRSEELPAPGSFLVRDLAGESIFLCRNRDGELRGFYNVCSHRGTKFLDDDACGTVQKVFKCPYHAWTYDTDGQLVGTPNVKEDEAFDRSKYPLFGFATEEYAGFLFVNLAKDGPSQSLLEQLTAGAESITTFERFRMQDLRIGARIVYEVQANWKIVVENYNECLHCPQVHPELVQVIPLYRMGEIWDESEPNAGNSMIEGATSFTPTGTSSLPKFPDLEPEDYRMYYGTFEFPNLMINLHPDSIMYYIVYPHGPNSCTVVSEFLFRPETIADPSFDPSATVNFWDLISRQDWDVCERAQTGVGSRSFTTGIYPKQDRLLFFFNQQYRTAMGQPLV